MWGLVCMHCCSLLCVVCFGGGVFMVYVYARMMCLRELTGEGMEREWGFGNFLLLLSIEVGCKHVTLSLGFGLYFCKCCILRKVMLTMYMLPVYRSTTLVFPIRRLSERSMQKLINCSRCQRCGFSTASVNVAFVCVIGVVVLGCVNCLLPNAQSLISCRSRSQT